MSASEPESRERPAAPAGQAAPPPARRRRAAVRSEAVLALAALTGAAAGVAAVLLHGAVHGVSGLAFGGPIGAAGWARILAVPLAGNLVVAALIQAIAPGSGRNGVAEVMRSLARQGGRIAPRKGALAILAPALSIGTGGSVGPEGPIVLAGAAAGSGLGRALRLPPHLLRTLAGCGAAGGIAGIFNAPIAGVIFAGEVILGHFALGSLLPTVVAAAVAAAVARFAVGGAPAFAAPAYRVLAPTDVLLHVALGALAGLVSAIFVKSLEAAETVADRLRERWIARAIAGGAALGAIGLAFPRALGAGYDTVAEALSGRLLGHEALAAIAALALVKVLATCVTLGSGGAGGVFAPSLVIGVALGTAVGAGGRVLFGEGTAPPGAFALVGMAAVIAGGMRSPVGGMMIVFEMTGDYALIIPLMVASTISTFVARRLEPESLYTARLARLGVRVRPGVDREVLARLDVREALEPAAIISPQAPLAAVAEELRRSRAPAIGVADASGRFRGLIRPADVEAALREGPDLGGVLIAADILAPEAYVAGLEEDVSIVYDELALSATGAVPVVDDDGRLLGILRHRSVMEAYRAALLEEG